VRRLTRPIRRTARAAARTTATAVATLVLITGLAAPAYAGIGDLIDCDRNPDNPHCDVTARTDTTYVHTGGGQVVCRDRDGNEVPCHIPGAGWRGSDGCYYQQVPLQEVIDAFGDESRITEEARTSGVWLLRRCPVSDDPTDLTSGWYEWRPDSTPPGVSNLVDVAVDRLAPPAPEIALSPPPPAPQLVFLPTWLWLEGGTWSTRSATASVPGVTVTATARPTRVVWSTGDGGSRECLNPGSSWVADADPLAESPTCGYTYTSTSRSQPSGVFQLRATVTWAITWSGAGGAGTIAPLTTTATTDVRVVESLARNTGGPQ
jgi:hypothetical protein